MRSTNTIHFSSSKVKSKNIVENEISLRTTWHEIKNFSKHQWLSTINWQFSAYKSDDTIICWRLYIKSVYFVSKLTKWAQFPIDWLLTHELFSFKCEHWLICEKAHELFFWLIEGTVVMVHKLCSYFLEIAHI